VEPPDDEVLRQYPTIRAVGVASQSRAMTRDEMDSHLPAAFRALASLQPKFVHYKVCSTFDSSPEIGSIGRAIEIGQQVFDNRFVPLVVGAPSLQRFCVFGNLFARSGLASEVFRLDRHPTMRHHPATPMDESDLREHLARQTDLSIGLVDVLALERELKAAQKQLSQAAQSGANILLFDTLTDAHLETIGQLISDAQEQESKPLFVAGSSGVEYSLTKHWRSVGIARDLARIDFAAAVEPADRILVISGSCSPVSARQIQWAIENGFAEISLDAVALADADTAAGFAELANKIRTALDSGRSTVVHTCCGPDDSRLTAAPGVAGKIGNTLGKLLRDAVQSRTVKRVAVFGGDTSGSVARALGIDALEYVGPLEPGAPLCRVRSRDAAVDGLEIVFKGGQVGYDDFLNTVLQGRPSR
jgi:3-oxoisoapionate kinase